MKKGVSGYTIGIMLIIITSVISAVLIYSLVMSGMFPQLEMSVNKYVLGPAGAPIKIFSFGKIDVEKLGVKAVITSNPDYSEHILCYDEEITLSSSSSQLPEEVYWSDVTCIWDLDTELDTVSEDELWSGDKIKDNDEDSTSCILATKFKQHTTQISLKIITPSNLDSTTTAEIKTSGDIGLCVDDFEETASVNRIKLKFPVNYRALDARIYISPVSKLHNFAVDIGGDSSYELEIDGLNLSKMLYGFHEDINNYLDSGNADCYTENNREICEVPVAWKLDAGSFDITKIRIPLVLKSAFI